MNKELIIDNFKKLCLEERQFPEPFSYKHTKIWTRDGITVFLQKEEEKLFYEILKEIITDPIIHQSFSVKDIETSIQEIITSVLKQTKEKREAAIVQEVDTLLTKLKSKISLWTFIIPIENLKLAARQFKVADVSLFMFTEFQAMSAIKYLRDILNDNKHYKNNSALKRKIIEKFRERSVDPLLGSTCAKVEVRGTVEGAQQIAIRKIDTVLSLIKLYSYSNDTFYGRYFGIKGEIIPSNHRSILRYKKDRSEFNPLLERTGYAIPFALDKERINFMEENGFNKLRDIVRKNVKTDFHTRLLNAIFWYSKAIDIPEVKKVEDKKLFGAASKRPYEEVEFFNLGDKFLKLIISLECLLIFGKENKSFNLRTRSSYILTDDIEERKRLQAYMKKAYETRSTIVHEGGFAVSKAETNQFMNYVQSVIIALLNNNDNWRINSNEDLYQWFEKNRLRNRLL